jgi:hypothetical protein
LYIHNWASREPVFVFAARGRGYVSAVAQQGPDGTGFPLNRLGIEADGVLY